MDHYTDSDSDKQRCTCWTCGKKFPSHPLGGNDTCPECRSKIDPEWDRPKRAIGGA